MTNPVDLERWHRKSAAQLSDPSKIKRSHRAAEKELLKSEDDENTNAPTKRNRRNRVRRSRSLSSPPESESEAWMCGVCGFVYSSKDACERHESDHVRKVLSGLGYLQTTESTNGTEPSNEGDIWPDNNGDDLLGFESDLPGETGEAASLMEFSESQSPETPFGQGRHEGYSNQSISLQTNTNSIFYADRALIQVFKEQAEPLMLTREEREAEEALKWLSADATHYEMLATRAAERRQNPTHRYRQPEEEAGTLGKLQNKMLDTYQLMKQSDGKKGISDCYNNKSTKSGCGDEKSSLPFAHLSHTLYVNVMVKNSVQVVRHELERLAKQRWERQGGSDSQEEPTTRFERFRFLTQTKAVKLAGLALSSDFTPRRIAVQLSNDLYRLLTPKLLKRGVSITAELEYRVGPYFCLAVNIRTIQWLKLLAVTARDVKRRQRSKATQDDEKATSRTHFYFIDLPRRLYHLSPMDAVAYAFSFLHCFHWVIAIPICWLSYQILGTSIRKFILASVMDEVFSFVERKGMEMDVKVCSTERQAAFMLQALREIRADGQELKKKQQESEESSGESLLGPLLGPAIAEDSNDAPPMDSLDLPENLEFVGLELELPVGFRRLRWAFLHNDSTFITEALFKTEAKYESIVMGTWNKHNDSIGKPNLSAEEVDPKEFIGAEKEAEYMMPKSAFVAANMCYETHTLIAYDDHCFCLKKKARNPDAPFGKTFVAWTQYLVVNTGNNTCKLTCSVEAEFPNGEPMVSRQIRSGMRAGTGELFVLIGETVGKYANEFP